MIVKCSTCSKNIYRANWRIKSSKNHFCCKNCSDKFLEKEKIIRNCKTCGKEFKFLKSRLQHSPCLFCSKECAYKDKEKPVNKTCKCCGKDFSVSLSQHNDGRGSYCSKKCAVEATRGVKITNGYGVFKSYSRSVSDKKCHFCSNNETVDLHHKDGDKYNNIPENWIFICRSCHLRIHSMKRKFNISFLDALKLYEKENLVSLSQKEFSSYAPAD